MAKVEAVQSLVKWKEMKVTVATTLLTASVFFSFVALSSSSLMLGPSMKYTNRRTREAKLQSDDAISEDSNTSGASQVDTDGLPLMPTGSGSAAEDYYSPEACDAHFKTSLSKLQGISRHCAESVPFSDCCQLKFLGVKKTGVYRIAGILFYRTTLTIIMFLRLLIACSGC